MNVVWTIQWTENGTKRKRGIIVERGADPANVWEKARQHVKLGYTARLFDEEGRDMGEFLKTRANVRQTHVHMDHVIERNTRAFIKKNHVHRHDAIMADIKAGMDDFQLYEKYGKMGLDPKMITIYRKVERGDISEGSDRLLIFEESVESLRLSSPRQTNSTINSGRKVGYI